MRVARWLAPLLVVSVLPPAVARAADCRSTGFSAQIFTGPAGGLRPASLIGSPSADVLLDASYSNGRRLVRRSAAHGKVVWRTALTGGGGHPAVTGRPGAETIVLLRAGDGCGDVFVSGVDGRSGRTRWSRHLPEFTTADRPDVEVFTPEVRDFDGDGVGDFAVLRVALPRLTPVTTECFATPSGHCLPLPPGWNAKVDVIDGRRGGTLISIDLGTSGAAPVPSIAWFSHGRTAALAVARQRADLTTEVMALLPGAKKAWTATGPAGAVDLALVASGSNVVLSTAHAVVPAFMYWFGTTSTVFSGATGATRWSATFAGPGTLFACRNGDVVAVSAGGLDAERRASATGAVIWQRPLPAAVRGYPDRVGDVDGKGIDDVVLYFANGSTVVSAETGSDLLTLATDEIAYRARDVTGDGRDDLVTIVAPTSTQPTVRLRSGTTLGIRWSRAVRFPKENAALGVEAGGGLRGAVIVYAIGSDHVTLDAASGTERWRSLGG